MIYSGIGSRETPDQVLIYMTALARRLSGKGFTLRSGGAYGADAAFAKGSVMTELYLPWDGYNGLSQNDSPRDFTRAFEIASRFHPKWDSLTRGARSLHGRNAYIVLGKTLDRPSDFILCYTDGGKIKGGTGQALRMAKHYNIPVFNFGALESGKLVDELSVFLRSSVIRSK